MNPTEPDTEMVDLLGAFVLDAAPDDDGRISAYLEAHAGAAGEVARMREACGALAEMTRTAPPPSLRVKLLAATSAVDRPTAASAPGPRIAESGSSRAPWGPRIFALAAALVLVLLLGAGVGLAVRSRGPAPVAANVKALQTLTLSGSEVVQLAPTGEGTPVPGLAVVISPDRSAYLVGASVPSPQPRRTHQLWVVPREASPQPAGTFGGGSPALALTVPVPAGATVAVTDEPAGGSATPTTPIANSAGAG